MDAKILNKMDGRINKIVRRIVAYLHLNFSVFKNTNAFCQEAGTLMLTSVRIIHVEIIALFLDASHTAPNLCQPDQSITLD